MCDPLSIGGLALAAGSTGLGMVGAQKQADARDDAMQAEFARQDRYSEGAMQAFDQSLGEYQDPAQDLAAKKAERRESLEGAVTGGSGGPGIPLPGSTPEVVKSEIARRMVEALDEGKAEARRMADLGAFGAWQQDTGRAVNQNQTEIGKYANFSRGSSGVLPQELQDANQEGAGFRFAGDILGAAGSAANMAGSMGYNPFSGGGGGGNPLGGAGPLQPWGKTQRKTKGYAGGIGF